MATMRPDPGVTPIRQIRFTGERRFVILREDLEIQRFDGDGLHSAGHLDIPGLAASALDPDDIKVAPDGMVVVNQSRHSESDNADRNVYLLDPLTGAIYSGILDLHADVFLDPATERRFLIDHGAIVGDQGAVHTVIEIVEEGGRLELQPLELSEEEVEPLLFAWCLERGGSAPMEPVPGFMSDEAYLHKFFRCAAVGDHVIFSNVFPTSFGIMRVDEIVGDGWRRDLKSVLSEATGGAEPAEIFTWVGGDASSGVYAVIHNRELLVFNNSGVRLQRTFVHAPGPARFVDGFNLAVHEPSAGRIGIHAFEGGEIVVPGWLSHPDEDAMLDGASLPAPLHRRACSWSNNQDWTDMSDPGPEGVEIRVERAGESNAASAVIISSPEGENRIELSGGCLLFAPDWSKVAWLDYVRAPLLVMDFARFLELGGMVEEEAETVPGAFESAAFLPSGDIVTAGSVASRLVQR